MILLNSGGKTIRLFLTFRALEYGYALENAQAKRLDRIELIPNFTLKKRIWLFEIQVTHKFEKRPIIFFFFQLLNIGFYFNLQMTPSERPNDDVSEPKMKSSNLLSESTTQKR